MLEFQIPSDEIIASMLPDDVERLKSAAQAWDHLQACKREVDAAGDALIATAQAFEDARNAIPKRKFIDDARLTFDRPPPDMAEEPAPNLPKVMVPAASEPIVEQIIGDRDPDDFRTDPVHRRR